MDAKFQRKWTKLAEKTQCRPKRARASQHDLIRLGGYGAKIQDSRADHSSVTVKAVEGENAEEGESNLQLPTR